MKQSLRFITSMFLSVMISMGCFSGTYANMGDLPLINQTTEGAIILQDKSQPPILPIQVSNDSGTTFQFPSQDIFAWVMLDADRGLGLQMNEIIFDQALQKMNEVLSQKGTASEIIINKKGELEQLTPSSQGVEIDFKKTKEDLIQRVQKGDYSPYQPYFTFGKFPTQNEETLGQINTILSEFSTAYRPYNKGQTANILHAAALINKTVLMPGEEFSFLATASPFTISNGYTNASVIQDGKFVDGIAGGACQASSTLFNAVLRTGMKVTARRNHSLPISYLPRGTDAAVATGLDFRFVNSLSHPVYIQSFSQNGEIFFRIYGNIQDYREVDISVKKTGERQYQLTRDIQGTIEYFQSTYQKPKTN